MKDDLVERLRDFPLPMLTYDECRTLREAADRIISLSAQLEAAKALLKAIEAQEDR